MEQFLVYLWLIMPQFHWITSIAILTAGISLIVYLGAHLVCRVEGLPNGCNEITNLLKKVVIASFAIMLINSFIPNRNGIVLLFATPKIVELSKDIADSNRTKG